VKKKTTLHIFTRASECFCKKCFRKIGNWNTYLSWHGSHYGHFGSQMHLVVIVNGKELLIH